MSSWRNVSLPLQVTLASVDEVPDELVLVTISYECLGKLELVSRNSTSSSREGQGSFLFISARFPGKISCLADVACEDNQIEVPVDVVHDLHLEEGLSSIVHDLIAEL